MDVHLRRRWRWVWYVVGVLLAGCNNAVPAMPNPTLPATLPGYTLVPPTLTPLPRLLRTPAQIATLGGVPGARPPRATPLPLALDPPFCTETLVGSLWCLGLIHNTLGTHIESVNVRVWLVDTKGNGLSRIDTPIARLSLWSGEESPYGALFQTIPEAYIGAIAELYSAKPATERPDKFQMQVSVESTTATMATLKIANPASQVAPESRVTLTFLNAHGQVAGYRVGVLGRQLAPGATALLTLDTGLVAGTSYTIRASAESMQLSP